MPPDKVVIVAGKSLSLLREGTVAMHGLEVTAEDVLRVEVRGARGAVDAPAHVVEYTDRYFKAVEGQSQDIADLVASASEMVKDWKSGRNFKIYYNMKSSQMLGNSILLREGARRIDFIEEFSHWRMKWGDKFLQSEKAIIKEALSNRRGISRVGTAAEEIAIKTHMIKNSVAFGLEDADVQFLTDQIKQLWENGAEHY